MKIRKKSGELQEYDQDKLERSILNAGASEEVAKRVIGRLLPLEGLSTGDLRRRIGEELNRENPALSGNYLSTVMLKATPDSNLSAGVAGLSPDLIIGLKSGLKAVLLNANNRAEVKLQSVPDSDPREIRISKVDMERLGTNDGARIMVRYPR